MGPHPLTALFATGAFLARPSASDLSEMLQVGFDRIKQSLVGATLRANNYFVMVDNSTSGQSKCASTTGSRQRNGECIYLARRNGAAQYPDDTIPVEADIMYKLDDPQRGYNVDPSTMYQNALECDGGRLDDDFTPLSGDLPKCFYSLPIVRTKESGSACSLIDGDMASASGMPAGMKLTRKSCGSWMQSPSLTSTVH